MEEEKINEVMDKVEERQFKKLDIQTMIQVLHIIKEMEMDEPADDEDEYLDTFVALGG